MWLTCSAEQEAAINSLLPQNIKVKAIGGKLLSDILQECGVNGLYAQAAHIIQALPVVNQPEA